MIKLMDTDHMKVMRVMIKMTHMTNVEAWEGCKEFFSWHDIKHLMPQGELSVAFRDII
jgi:hypothetical protein